MIVGITGGMGSGKSTVARILASALSAEYIDTDVLCRELMQPGNIGFTTFMNCYGNRFFLPDGGLDRVGLREAVFAEPQVKETLESILHPLVRDMVLLKGTTLAEIGKDCVVEVPLLFEVGWIDDFFATVLVYVPEETSCRRVVQRDGLDIDLVRKIISNQMNIEKKRKLADWVIDNTSTIVSSICQARYIAHTLRKVNKTTDFSLQTS